MRIATLSLRIFGYCLAAAIAVPVLVIAALQVPAGRSALSGVVGTLASSETRKITVTDLYLGFGLQPSAGRITIEDQQGPWLGADALAIGWSPLALLSGNLEIETLSVGQLNLNRLPQPPPPSETAEQTARSSGRFSLALPVNVDIGSLSLGEINIGAPVLGTPIALTLSGSGSAARDRAALNAALEIRRIDGVDGQLSAEADFDPGHGMLAFNVKISEPRGGLAARLLQIEDLPAISASLSGSGPLDDWAANLSVALDGRQTVTGDARLNQTETGRQLSFDLDGDLAPLAPQEVEAFFLGTTEAAGTAVFSNTFEPQSGQIDLKTRTVRLTASGTNQDDQINALADLDVSAGEDALIALDMGDRRIAFGPLTAQFSINGSRTNAVWSADADLSSLQTTQVRTGALTLKASGSGADLTARARSTPFELAFSGSGISDLTGRSGLSDQSLSLSASGGMDGITPSLTLSTADLSSELATLSLTNAALSRQSASGQGELDVTGLDRLSRLAGRELGGSAKSRFSFDLDPVARTGTAEITAALTDLKTGLAHADGLLSGTTSVDLSARFNGPSAIDLSKLSVSGPGLTLGGTATYASAGLSSNLTATLPDLSKVDPQLSGAVDLSVTTSGPTDRLAITASVSSSRILLAGTPLDTIEMTADGIADPAAPTARISGSASLNGQPVSVDLDLASEGGSAVLSPLSIDLAGNTIKGSLTARSLSRPLQTLQGTLAIDAPDLAAVSPLVLTDLDGQINGTLTADPDARKFLFDLEGSDIKLPGISAGTLRLQANVTAPYNPDTLEADIEILDLVTNATPIRSVSLTASPEDGGTSFSADIELTEGEDDGLSLAAHLSEPTDDHYALLLQQMTMQYQGLSSALRSPATVTYASGTADIEPLEFQLGSGSLSVSGRAGDELDLKAVLTGVPLDLANAFVPTVGLGGTLSGTVNASGTAAAPATDWTVNAAGLTAATLKKNGVTPLAVNTTGRLDGNTVSQQTRITDTNGLAVSSSGKIEIEAPRQLAMTLSGTIPAGVFRVPLLKAGIRAEGAITLDGAISGSLSAPAYQISAVPSALKLTSLSTGLTVQDIRGSATATQDQLTLNGISGNLASGGSLNASGTVAMRDDFAADLTLAIDQARYIDPGLVTGEIDANINVTGPLASTVTSALIAGSVTINSADVSIPEDLPGAIPPLEVQHLNASPAIQRQIAELGGGSQSPGTEQTTNPPRLDVAVSAPGRIFIRGRGLDAELEGNLRIVGTTADPQAIGAFSLRRGQLDILARRLTFQRGTATFEGSLTPLLDFAATTSVDATAITVTVSGAADDPQIDLSSSPQLPEDEVLALLLFGERVGDLSTGQIAQLAAAVSTLTGGRDTGPLAQIRKSLGLDAIDIDASGEDGPSVSVGKYISDNIFLGVEQGAGSGSSRVRVDIDLNRGLKMRGEVGADGSSKAGIFFEREY